MKKQEASLQQACVYWFRLQYPRYSKLLIHVPNGGSRNPIEAANLKKQGVVAGVADLLLLLPRKGFGCLCIELKSEKGKQTEKQKEWQIKVEENGNKYAVCNSIENFILLINDYVL